MIDWGQVETPKTAGDIQADRDVEHARGYLKETDWHAFALLEDGTPIPDDIKEARTAARATINRLSPAPAA